MLLASTEHKNCRTYLVTDHPCGVARRNGHDDVRHVELHVYTAIELRTVGCKPSEKSMRAASSIEPVRVHAAAAADLCHLQRKLRQVALEPVAHAAEEHNSRFTLTYRYSPAHG